MSSALGGADCAADINAASDPHGSDQSEDLEIKRPGGQNGTRADQAVSLGESVLDNLVSFQEAYPTDAMASVISPPWRLSWRDRRQVVSSLRQGNDSIGSSVETASGALTQVDSILQEAGEQFLSSRDTFDRQVLPGSAETGCFFRTVGRLSGLLDGVEPSAEQVNLFWTSLPQAWMTYRQSW